MKPTKFLITGGARSGKSRHAQAVAESLGPHRTYLATAEPFDDEMRDRIRRHREDRGAGWHTVEAPLWVGPELARDSVVVVDCLTLWLSNWLHARGEAPLDDVIDTFIADFVAAPNPVILVTNEVGLGIVPDNALARRFRDEAGRVAQRAAAVADRVVWCVAGIPVTIK